MKLMKVLVAVLVMAGLVVPAMAEDKLSLSGSMEVRGYYVDQDDDGTKTSDAWNYQRLRTAGALAVAEGVSVHFRFDVTESPENLSTQANWGSSGVYTQRRADIQYDLAYLKLVKNGYTFMAGELYSGYFGIGNLSDSLGAGFVVSKGPATVYHIKIQDETTVASGSIAPTGKNEASLTGAKFDIKGDNFTLTPMVAYSNTSGDDADVFGAGLYLTAKLGAAAIKAELDYFDGENAAGTVDQKGLQAYLDVSAPVSDKVTLGAMLLWADAQDGGDEQITRMVTTGFGGWSPFTYGYNSTDFLVDVHPFEVDTNAGIQAVNLYSDVKVSDDLGLKFAAGFFQTDDDDVSDLDGFSLNASSSYSLMKNTALNVSLNYIAVDDNGSDYDAFQTIAGVYVKF